MRTKVSILDAQFGIPYPRSAGFDTDLAQTNKNLTTNAIKGLSNPSRPLAKVRSDRDNKINIFGIFVV